jgi:hypothetical protein
MGCTHQHCTESGSFRTYRWVQIDEDGAGNVFAVAGLREEGFERSALVEVLRIGVGATVSLETMLKEVPDDILLVYQLQRRGDGVHTAPKRCYLAACQLGRCEGGRSAASFCQQMCVCGSARDVAMLRCAFSV